VALVSRRLTNQPTHIEFGALLARGKVVGNSHFFLIGSDGRPRAWYIDVDEANQLAEIEFLQTAMHLKDIEPRVQIVSAMNLFSGRL